MQFSKRNLKRNKCEGYVQKKIIRKFNTNPKEK